MKEWRLAATCEQGVERVPLHYDEHGSGGGKTGKRGWETSYEDIRNSLYPVDRWILSKLNTLVKEVTDNMDSFELGIAVQKVYDFIWDEFCDWYIEMVKPRLYSTDEKDSEGKAGSSVDVTEMC